ncbi:MAG: hypothetical protein KGZ50_09810 [Peptococcaceae bacterium]|nr:hypothetical protein [Peptococcaceae bacterium]
MELNFPLSRRELEARIARTDAFFALWEAEERGELTHMKSRLGMNWHESLSAVLGEARKSLW